MPIMRSSVHWERLALLKTPMMVILGLALAVVGVFVQFGQGWGLLAAGVAVLLFAFLTDSPAEETYALGAPEDTDATASISHLNGARAFVNGAAR